ncbi:hypothetical protein H257_18080 [Aphanomyces astaci]|uniref:Uncharacterized protein n=1 Tax=Aphanomyces astaci TaxID=112090 RepID=W4FEI4_APHAT|nr:hypothetical protein H257_18080 [Aphanomyces astaci]ETV65123.1 hypothetical protein H257_18080 [Aphanomyces astaci]|eukprot:XP_009845392.1 hypothetical protein H257_18080 [Aphanomyces astaci]
MEDTYLLLGGTGLGDNRAPDCSGAGQRYEEWHGELIPANEGSPGLFVQGHATRGRDTGYRQKPGLQDATSLRQEARAGCATATRTAPGRQHREHKRRRKDWSSGSESDLDKTIGETSGTMGVYTGPSAGDDSRRQTDGSEDKEEKGIYTEPYNEEKSIKTIGETSGTTGEYIGPSTGDDSRRQTGGSEDKEEKGMYAKPSKEESSCRQTEPNTRDASASPDGDSQTPRGAASVLSRTLPRVRGQLTNLPGRDE